jgi:energy-coupling factor transport system ATP-binding protein
MTRPALIDMRDVVYTYPGAGAPALRGVTLRVRAGEFLAVVGHNGSGKSTLARHCNALLAPQSGRVTVAGLDTRDPAHRRAIRDAVGMVFQSPDNQIIATVVEDDVAWALAVRGLPATAIHARVDRALRAVGIEDLRALPPNRLSGGQRQRVTLAGVLALRPRCIVADEATSQLDPLARREIVAILRALNREHGLTIVHVTHRLEETAQADRIVALREGAVALTGTPPEVFADLERLRRLHLAVPEPLELAERLRAAGLSIARGALTVETIARELAP